MLSPMWEADFSQLNSDDNYSEYDSATTLPEESVLEVEESTLSESSSNHSDTEFEGDVNLEWDKKNYSALVTSKHWQHHLREKSFITIVSIVDRRQEDWVKNPSVSYLPIFHKPNIYARPQLKHYYSHNDRLKYVGNIFTPLPYPSAKTYVHWPSNYPETNDHSPASPYYCLVDWKDQL